MKAVPQSATWRSRARSALAFRAVNRPGQPGYQPAMQRHHLLPRQLLGCSAFARMFAALGLKRMGFDDFRRNGLLLPSSEEAVERVRLPLHRGPHNSYNAMVEQRVGQIEADWETARARDCRAAREQALMRLDLLQSALRRRLLMAQELPIRLNRNDPLGTGLDFTELDAMAEALWQASAPVTIEPGADREKAGT